MKPLLWCWKSVRGHLPRQSVSCKAGWADWASWPTFTPRCSHYQRSTMSAIRLIEKDMASHLMTFGVKVSAFCFSLWSDRVSMALIAYWAEPLWPPEIYLALVLMAWISWFVVSLCVWMWDKVFMILSVCWRDDTCFVKRLISIDLLGKTRGRMLWKCLRFGWCHSVVPLSKIQNACDLC